MKAWQRRGTAGLFLCGVGVIIALMGRGYFRYISQRVYEDSTNHLVEVYGQVNHNFASFLERNWGSLKDWEDHIYLEKEEDVLGFLEERQAYWGFSQFYFLAPDGTYLTPSGEKGQLKLEDTRDALFAGGERIMSNETLPDGQAVTVFAIPVPEGVWRDVSYRAIAVSYTNADMVRALNVDAFDGQSTCFVTDAEGNVLLSTGQGGSVFGNYLTYLRAASDLEGAELEELHKNWGNGASGVIVCRLGGVSYYISYQSVGYQNCVLLGLVPESAASESLLQIQRATVNVLVKTFLLAGTLLIVWLACQYRKKTKKSAMEIQYRDMMFDTLSVNVNDIFLMLDANTFRVDFLSSNVERLLGISRKEVLQDIRLLGKHAEGEGGFLDREEFAAIPIHDSRQWESEYIHQKNGERRWYRENVYHETIQGMEKYLIIMSDRTQERQMNQHLRQALDAAKSANEAKSHFLSNMSHDIRTPMNAIIGFSVLLAKDAENPDKVREYTRKISASGQHLLSLINDVLDMSKIESGKTSLNVLRFSLPALMEELYMILLPQAKAKGQSVEFYVQGHPAEELMGDRLRLNQILLNLLSNAVKYTPTGGNIVLVVEEMPQLSPQFACLRFLVKDNGIGMSEEFVATVFEPFSREASAATNGIQGTGLGMAITKNLVELMGGVIRVESRLGQGSVFTVELSFAIPASEVDEDFWRHKGITRILTIDDEESICLGIRSMMKNVGVEVSYVNEGAAAAETVQRAKEEGREFQLILLDWQMPGMGGMETAVELRKVLPEAVPILVLTAYDWSEIEEEARAAGVNAFIPKPFFVSTFRQAVENLEPVYTQMDPDVNECVLEGMMFLVAEDNELNAEILSEMLDMEGARCEVAENGKKALDRFLQSAPGAYNMILMDVQMPVMGGYEATRAIRACGHPMAAVIPIVAMTANAFAEDVRDALASGMDAHLAKPIDMDAVKAVIGQLRKDGTRRQRGEGESVG